MIAVMFVSMMQSLRDVRSKRREFLREHSLRRRSALELHFLNLLKN
jgi:hypothetical protein